MHRIYGLLLITFLLLSCNNKIEEKEESDTKLEFNQALADELYKMAEIDQLAAINAYPPKTHSHMSQPQWITFKDSIYRTNQKRAEEILETHGFVGYDLAGKEGSLNFWLVVQHADHDPEFQQRVLEKMKLEVDKGNADLSNYALLVDRVKLNTGQQQIYGTQVAYNTRTGQAYARNLADSTTVNTRRKSVGLKPLEVYLNDMSTMHFEMNKKLFAEKGLTGPKLYMVE